MKPKSSELFKDLSAGVVCTKLAAEKCPQVGVAIWRGCWTQKDAQDQGGFAINFCGEDTFFPSVPCAR